MRNSPPNNLIYIHIKNNRTRLATRESCVFRETWDRSSFQQILFDSATRGIFCHFVPVLMIYQSLSVCNDFGLESVWRTVIMSYVLRPPWQFDRFGRCPLVPQIPTIGWIWKISYAYYVVSRHIFSPENCCLKQPEFNYSVAWVGILLPPNLMLRSQKAIVSRWHMTWRRSKKIHIYIYIYIAVSQMCVHPQVSGVSDRTVPASVWMLRCVVWRCPSTPRDEAFALLGRKNTKRKVEWNTFRFRGQPCKAKGVWNSRGIDDMKRFGKQ